MKNDPLISIIIPVYNTEKYLNRCLESIRRQTYQWFECIVVDDGSSDSSGAIADRISKVDNRFIVYHKTNGGLSSARNYGIERCRGAYITFVDSDDWVENDYLAALCSLAKSYDADIVVSPFIRTSEYNCAQFKKRPTERIRQYTQQEYLKVFFRFEGNRTIHYAWGKLFKKRLVDENQFPLGMLNEDVEGFFKALIKADTIIETNVPYYFYFINQNGITGSRFGENYTNLTEVWDRIVDIAAKERPDLVEAAKYNLKRADFTILCDMIVHGSIDSDVEYARVRDVCIKRFRGNLLPLLKGKMQAQRKVALIAIAVGFRPICWIYRKKQKFFSL